MIFFGSKERARARSRDQGFKGGVVVHTGGKATGNLKKINFAARGQIERKFEVLIPEK